MQYPIVLHTDDGESFGVTVPDVPGCFSAGDTFEEALRMAKEAITGHVQLMVDDGETVPLPRSFTEHRDNPDYADGVWAIVEIDSTQFDKRTEKVNVTLPSRLIKEIDSTVEARGMKSRSGFLADAARFYTNHLKAG